ncbi:PilZ domain-containing protein [Sphingomicrobium lutaoense]|uniref:PilZ domain-containing protein n=1 Tax=Sphingomicrobium lutaoense TaxID=515949 RepID=A0A839Z537_9SPHN|nr:PilZ domain-containing protein [Sphingomicrobium lutaoense]MBB3764993.1 hypothetical protein [Sphingomicrobium lutaoense]
MNHKQILDGSMIPRTVKRMFDERLESRHDAGSQTAVMGLRGESHVVRLINISDNGAMVIYPGMPHIGEQVTLQLLDMGEVTAVVRWVRDGRIGVNFAD